ncbi:hypothetical protein acdb102_01470 [Acidothermaceae bacterium B102]|nr:hypothetical protein acdb102_01470 [Acidothermaceae bacterium B102]
MRTAAISTPPANKLRLPDGTRSVQSPWVWRGFFFLSLIAFGLALTLAVGGQWVFAGAWLFITVGWFAISMWLWRKNILLDRAEYAAQRPTRPKG